MKTQKVARAYSDALELTRMFEDAHMLHLIIAVALSCCICLLLFALGTFQHSYIVKWRRCLNIFPNDNDQSFLGSLSLLFLCLSLLQQFRAAVVILWRRRGPIVVTDLQGDPKRL